MGAMHAVHLSDDGYCYDAEFVSAIEGHRKLMTRQDDHDACNLLQQYMAVSGYYEGLIAPRPEEAEKLKTELTTILEKYIGGRCGKPITQ